MMQLARHPFFADVHIFFFFLAFLRAGILERENQRERETEREEKEEEEESGGG